MVNPPVMTLEQLAALPLDRIVVSACCATGGDGLGPVGGIKAKFEAATRGLSGDRSLVAFGIATDQKNLPDDPVVVRGGTLGELLSELSPVLPRLFGPILSLPPGLDGVAGDHYDARRFHPFPWLNAKIAQALSEDAKREQPGGYLFIEGGPARGKTSWALDWQRASAGFSQSPATGASAERLPPLTAWFFARRYGVGNGFGNPYLREENALQTLISMARLRRNAPSSAESRLLLADLNHSYGYRNIEDQKRLGSAFQTALTDLAASEPRPSAEHPLLLLLDGADELFSQGEGTFQVRHVFPAIFPKQLPPWTYLVILSRPGRHLLLGQADIQPVLHYQFTKEDVEQAIDHYLNAVALNEANPFDLDEQKILRDPDFQRQVREASEGAFGYVSRLMDDLIKQPNAKQSKARNRLAQLRRWRDVPGSLPQGVYEQRARELVGLCQALEEQQRGQARRLTRALASLALLQEQPLLSVAGLTDLVVEPAEIPEPPVAHSPLPKAASATMLPQGSPPLPISLADLATLPLERVVVSGYCRSALTDEALGPVSRLCENLATPVPAEILAFGGAAGQMELSAKWPTITAGTLSELLGSLNRFLAPHVFGPILEPPPALLDSPDHAGGHADYLEAFVKLNQAVGQALRTAPSGYLFIEGEPASGKTRWALDWQRYSARHDPLMPTTAYPLPPLSAWFFAGHDGVGATSGDPAYLKEVNALQTLISMARRQRGVQAREHRVHLLSPALAADYDYQNREQQTVLREAFQAALYELATARHAPPTANNPLLLLLDGADRLFGADDGVLQPRIGFPWIFPDALPDHTYLVIGSRPGQHLWLGQRDITPLLRYRLSAELPTSAAPSDFAQPLLSKPCAIEYQETVADQGRRQRVWQEKKQIRKALGEAHQFFMGPPPGQKLVFLQFDHSLTAELVLAKQQVESTVDLFTVTGDTIKHWHLIAYCAQSTTDHAEKPNFEPPQGARLLSASERQAANMRLHRAIGERSARYWPTLDTVRPASKTAIAEWPSKRRYAVLWGLHHAFQGAVGCTEQDASPAVAKALPLLLHAGYLQTAVRVGGEGSLDALRETYIAADQVPHAQEDQSLRHRIESHLLHWHPHLVADRLQVGALLWNYLGCYSLDKLWTESWKASLDRPMLLTTLPGIPMDLIRWLPGNAFSLSSCGQWLATVTEEEVMLWDLRQGVHRVQHTATWNGAFRINVDFFDLPRPITCIATASMVTIVAVEQEENLAVLTFGLTSKRNQKVRFTMHRNSVSSSALHVAEDGTLIIICAGHYGTVDILALNADERRELLEKGQVDDSLCADRLRFFTGHHDSVYSIALHVSKEGALTVACGGGSKISLLALTSDECQELLLEGRKNDQRYSTRLRCFSGQSIVSSVALHVAEDGALTVACGYGNQVGVLALTQEERQELLLEGRDNDPRYNTRLRCFTGHQNSVDSIALHVSEDGALTVASQSSKELGVLALTSDEYRELLLEGKENDPRYITRLWRFLSCRSWALSVTLHIAQDGTLTMVSGDDKKVDVLMLSARERAMLLNDFPDKDITLAKSKVRMWTSPLVSAIRWSTPAPILAINLQNNFFFGISSDGLVIAKIDSTENLLQFPLICPFSIPNFTPRAIAFDKEGYGVIAGEHGKKISIICLKWLVF